MNSSRKFETGSTFDTSQSVSKSRIRLWNVLFNRRSKRKQLYSFKNTDVLELPKINIWLTFFVFGTFFMQIMLIPQQLFPIRTYLRIAMFACSLALLFVVPGKMKFLPATSLAMLIVGIFCLGLLHPETNSPVSAAAAIMLNFAIISPIFWVPRLKLDTEQFRMTLIMIWAFHAASSGLGILEVYYPDQFSRESKITELFDKIMVEGLQVTLADGTRVYRPMGFSDSPGGAAASGYLAILLGSGLLLTRTHIVLKVLFLASVAAGLFCILLCQIRSLVILAVLCELAMVGVLALRGQVFRIIGMLVVIPVLVVGASLWAFSIGGEQVSNRLLTMTEGSAGEFYYSKRGRFLEEFVNELLPMYPLGAGLGRWGMTNAYFGDRASTASVPIWVEIQPNAWLLDGGVPLVLAYYAAILLCIAFSFKLAVIRKGIVADFATIVFTLNLAIFANTFSYVPFIGQSGLTFWLMNGCLMALALTCQDVRRKKISERNRVKQAIESLGKWW